jgi:pentatricopeptide repeat protein
LNMKDPEAARRLLQRARIPQSVYSWNLVIKYYAHKGNYLDAYKTYQQVFIPCLRSLAWSYFVSILLVKCCRAVLIVDEEMRRDAY